MLFFCRFTRVTLSFALLLLATAASALSPAITFGIFPGNPRPLEPVRFRFTTDECSFNQAPVAVTQAAGVVQVRYRPNTCFAPSDARTVEVGVGSFPAGEVRVEYFIGEAATPAHTYRVSVNPGPEIAVFPPPPRPLVDYSGLWWYRGETGTALGVFQSPSGAMFAGWYVYDETGKPTWFSLQGGAWTSATTYSGDIYRSTGSSYSALLFDPTAGSVQKVGTGTLDFKVYSHELEDTATLSLTINGQPIVKRVARFQF